MLNEKTLICQIEILSRDVGDVLCHTKVVLYIGRMNRSDFVDRNDQMKSGGQLNTSILAMTFFVLKIPNMVIVPNQNG